GCLGVAGSRGVVDPRRAAGVAARGSRTVPNKSEWMPNAVSADLGRVQTVRPETERWRGESRAGHQQSEPEHLPRRRDTEVEGEIVGEGPRGRGAVGGPNPQGFEESREQPCAHPTHVQPPS